MNYCTVAELKGRLDVASTDTEDDDIFQSIANGISRQIDEQMRRRFYVTDDDETRYFTLFDPSLLYVGDLVSITTLKTDSNGDRTYESTWASTDYDLEPYNASLLSRPYSHIRTTPLGTKVFPAVRRGIEIAGKWGWPAIPSQIKEATLLISERLYFRKDAVFGIVKGAPELGEVRRIIMEDPEVQGLLHSMDKKGVLV